MPDTMIMYHINTFRSTNVDKNYHMKKNYWCNHLDDRYLWIQGKLLQVLWTNEEWTFLGKDDSKNSWEKKILSTCLCWLIIWLKTRYARI